MLRFNERSLGIIETFGTIKFHILGCGAIGSSAATQLARMGADNFILYDIDKVGMENIGVSQYTHKDIGKPKVHALKKHIQLINENSEVELCYETFDNFICEPLTENDIIILGFDNMAIRLDAAIKATQKTFVGQNKPLCIIDGRMGAEEYQQYTILNPTLAKYKKYWYSDEQASDDPCNAKATAYCSNMSGSFIANSVKKVLNKERYNEEFFFNFPTLMLGKSQQIQ